MRPWCFGGSGIPFSFTLPNLLPILMGVCEFTVFTPVWQRRGFSLQTYLRWVGSPNTALHGGSTPRQVLMTKRWSPRFLQSLLGSESHRHHQSSQTYKRKARAGGDFEALGGRGSRAHPFRWQRGSKYTGNSSDTCGCEDQEWVQYAQVLSKSSRIMPR